MLVAAASTSGMSNCTHAAPWITCVTPCSERVQASLSPQSGSATSPATTAMTSSRSVAGKAAKTSRRRSWAHRLAASAPLLLRIKSTILDTRMPLLQGHRGSNTREPRKAGRAMPRDHQMCGEVMPFWRSMVAAPTQAARTRPPHCPMLRWPGGAAWRIPSDPRSLWPRSEARWHPLS